LFYVIFFMLDSSVK